MHPPASVSVRNVKFPIFRPKFLKLNRIVSPIIFPNIYTIYKLGPMTFRPLGTFGQAPPLKRGVYTLFYPGLHLLFQFPLGFPTVAKIMVLKNG
ncbi:hypothetical protein Hanom_Chr06g00577011 [Helianthus anomalus]